MNGEEIAIKTWDLYYAPEEYTVYNKDIECIVELRKAISIPTDDLQEIITSQIFRFPYEKFKLFYSPGFKIDCINCAASERIFEATGKKVPVHTVINDVTEVNAFSDVSTSNVGSLVNLIGTVCRIGFKKIENIIAHFECVKCNTIIRQRIANNTYKPPLCSCKNKTVIFLPGHNENICTDKQDIKIQETYSKDSTQAILDVELLNNFVGSVAPGDVIQIVGFVKAEASPEGYRLKLECNNLSIIKNKNLMERDNLSEDLRKNPLLDSYGEKLDQINIEEINAGTSVSTNKSILNYCGEIDFQLFKKISEEENLISIFMNNLFPDIYGNDEIKAGLVLALFGGTKKHVGECFVRSEIHVLIVGDPGMGKSKMLLSLAGILPKSTYVSGSFCTNAGLTVSITHDPATGEYMADAGALVISDGGLCCIDEFDKIDDHASLFEVMEDQQVTVAKGGVVCSVPTRTTIIAASNPRHGHFDKSKSIRENLKFDSALLSRFDLIFIMMDNLSEQENYEVSYQILKKRLCGSEGEQRSEVEQLFKDYHSSTFVKHSSSIYSKDTLKKYIEYAKNNVAPILSTGAKAKLQEYFLSIRANKFVSIRTLESLMRLTESCAKMELKSIASMSHALFSIKLHKKILLKEETKNSKNSKKLEDYFKEYTSETGSDTITLSGLEEIIRKASPNKDPNVIIEMLNYRGTIIKKGKNEYKFNLI